MENYRELFRVVVEHDYYEKGGCRAFSCALTPQGASLVQRRGFCFKQLADNEWALLYQDRPALADDMTLVLSCSDASFPLYTQWDGYAPFTVYSLELPSKETVEADADFVPREGGRGLGMGMCSIRLHLDGPLYDAAEAGTPMRTVIHFKARAARWSYLFISREGREFAADRLRLEDETGQVSFSDFVDDGEHPNAVSTTSQGEIPLRRSYDCRLRLVALDANDRKIVLLTNVAPPEPGRFLDAPQGTVQSICYY